MKYLSGRKCLLGLASGVALVAMSGYALAHHSFAAYNMVKLEKTEGTLKQFRWGAPHSSMVIYYEDANGERAQMSLVSGSPLMFSKQGFNPRSFKSGDKVTVAYHPNVNGQPGGALSELVLEDGRKFSDTEAASAAPPGSE